MDCGGASKDGGGRAREVKYHGVQMQKNGQYMASIRYVINRQSRMIYIGTFATAEEAARAYDKDAYKIQGNMAVLNFPAERPPTFLASDSIASTMAATAGATKSSSRGNVQGREVFDDEKPVELDLLSRVGKNDKN